MVPQARQVYTGRTALYEFFASAAGPEKPHMNGHRLAFDPATQVGFGEYTVGPNSRYHGVVAVKLENAKIHSWREYQYKSDLDRESFTRNGHF
jgi:hypothetical protein